MTISGWAGLPAALTNTTLPVTAKQRVVIIIPGDQPEEGIDGHGWKDFQKRCVPARGSLCGRPTVLWLQSFLSLGDYVCAR